MISIRLSSALALLVLAGCAQVQVRPVPLPLPSEPVLTPVKSGAFNCPVPLPSPWAMCMTDKTYTALVNRERGLRTWARELQAVIAANNAKAKP